VDTGLNAIHSNRGDQCLAPKFNMEEEYTMFMEDMAQKGIEVECRFICKPKNGCN